MLRVGGYVLQPLARSARTDPRSPLTDYPFLPPGALFVEPLRGFEDYPFAVDRIAIGSATYRLPIIIDYGWASTLGAAAGAVRAAGRLRPVRASRPATAPHRVATAPRADRCRCSCAFWVIPITVQYQLARRFTDDQALVHLVQIGL